MKKYGELIQLKKRVRCPSCGGLCDHWPEGSEVCFGCKSAAEHKAREAWAARVRALEQKESELKLKFQNSMKGLNDGGVQN